MSTMRINEWTFAVPLYWQEILAGAALDTDALAERSDMRIRIPRTAAEVVSLEDRVEVFDDCTCVDLVFESEGDALFVDLPNSKDVFARANVLRLACLVVLGPSPASDLYPMVADGDFRNIAQDNLRYSTLTPEIAHHLGMEGFLVVLPDETPAVRLCIFDFEVVDLVVPRRPHLAYCNRDALMSMMREALRSGSNYIFGLRVYWIQPLCPAHHWGPHDHDQVLQHALPTHSHNWASLVVDPEPPMASVPSGDVVAPAILNKIFAVKTDTLALATSTSRRRGGIAREPEKRVRR